MYTYPQGRGGTLYQKYIRIISTGKYYGLLKERFQATSVGVTRR